MKGLFLSFLFTVYGVGSTALRVLGYCIRGLDPDGDCAMCVNGRDGRSSGLVWCGILMFCAGARASRSLGVRLGQSARLGNGDA